MFSVTVASDPVYTIQPVVNPVIQPVSQPVDCLYTRYNRLFSRLFSRLSNRLFNRFDGTKCNVDTVEHCGPPDITGRNSRCLFIGLAHFAVVYIG